MVSGAPDRRATLAAALGFLALEGAIAWSRFVLPALRLEADGFDAWDQVKRGGWEGLVAKDDTSSLFGALVPPSAAPLRRAARQARLPGQSRRRDG